MPLINRLENIYNETPGVALIILTLLFIAAVGAVYEFWQRIKN